MAETIRRLHRAQAGLLPKSPVPTPARTRRIVRLLESGSSFADVSIAAGLPAGTAEKWYTRGARGQKGDEAFAAFRDAIRLASVEMIDAFRLLNSCHAARLAVVEKVLLEVRARLTHRRTGRRRPAEANRSAGKPPRTRPSAAGKR